MTRSRPETERACVLSAATVRDGGYTSPEGKSDLIQGINYLRVKTALRPGRGSSRHHYVRIERFGEPVSRLPPNRMRTVNSGIAARKGPTIKYSGESSLMA